MDKKGVLENKTFIIYSSKVSRYVCARPTKTGSEQDRAESKPTLREEAVNE